MTLFERITRRLFGCPTRREPSDVQIEARMIRKEANDTVTRVVALKPRDWRDVQAADMYRPRRKRTAQ